MIDIKEHGGGYGGGIPKSDLLKYEHISTGATFLDSVAHGYNFIHALGNGLAIQYAWVSDNVYTRRLVQLGEGTSSYIKSISSSLVQNGTLVDVDYTNHSVVFASGTRLVCINSNLDVAWDIPFPVAQSGALGICIRKGVILVYNSTASCAFVDGATGQIIQSFNLSSFNYSPASACVDFNDDYIAIADGNTSFRLVSRSALTRIATTTTSWGIMGLALTKNRVLALTRDSYNNNSYTEHYSWNGTVLGARESAQLAYSNQNTSGANKNLLRVVNGVIYAHSYDLYALSSRGNSLAMFPRGLFASSGSVLQNVSTDGKYITCLDSNLKMCTAKISVFKTTI